jgi:hypothetical protein
VGVDLSVVGRLERAGVLKEQKACACDESDETDHTPLRAAAALASVGRGCRG